MAALPWRRSRERRFASVRGRANLYRIMVNEAGTYDFNPIVVVAWDRAGFPAGFPGWVPDSHRFPPPKRSLWNRARARPVPHAPRTTTRPRARGPEQRPPTRSRVPRSARPLPTRLWSAARRPRADAAAHSRRAVATHWRPGARYPVRLRVPFHARILVCQASRRRNALNHNERAPSRGRRASPH